MEFPPFASLGQVRILLVPVGNIKKQSFNKWASLLRSFETIRLGDIPPDAREDRARFMPSPLSTGHLHLSFPSHPPPAWHASLALFRPSEFPLGVIGIADCSASSSLQSIFSQFNASMLQLLPPNTLFPLAQNCYVFEDSEGHTIANLGDPMPGLAVIPSVMGNKGLYVGTLLAELCSSILGEFATLASTVESPIGMEYLYTSIFPTTPNFFDQRNFHGSMSSRHSLPPSPAGLGSSNRTELDSFRSSTPSVKHTSAFDVGRPMPHRNASLAPNVATKSIKRQSGLTVPPTGRLFKLLGDLFLLAGRCSDAGVWYGESLSLLSKSPQDTVWHASALEGLCTVQVLDAWSTGHGINTSFSTEVKEPWLDISESLAHATALYSKAMPGPHTLVPEVESSLIVLLLTTCICRHSALLFSIWASKGWGALAFTTLIQPGLPPTFTPKPPTESQRMRMSAITGISRGQIAGVLAQAHGPFLLHLEPHDRIRLLQQMASTYSFLGFCRKEAYILRELLSTVMDVLVCGRDEAIKSTRERGSGVKALESAGTGLGIVDAGAGTIGIRENESTDGNESIIRLIKYVCEVYGVDLGSVKIVAPNSKSEDDTGMKDDVVEGYKLHYGWDELQLGVVREAAAIAEALPDYPTVAQFNLSALRALHAILSPSDQAFLYTNSIKALMTARRRGDDRRLPYWSGNPVVSIEISPLPMVRLPVEHPIQDLLPARANVDAVTGRLDPFIYNPRLVSSKSKAQTIVVQNEPLEFVLTLQNPYAFDLEVQSLTLSTSGVLLQSQPLAVTIPANSYYLARIAGTVLQPGTLIIRGCIVQAQGGTSREFVMPHATEEEERLREKRRSVQNTEIGRVKETGLDARLWVRDRRAHIAGRLPTVAGESEVGMKFLECNVVPQQPLMRIRRTSLTHGAVMMYDGETSTIRLTVENVSTIPIDFIKLAFDDSTIMPAQQALADGDLSVFEAYETEYDLLHRPVFRWDAENEPKTVAPGRKTVLNVICSGKVGCTSGTIQISYSRIDQESSASSGIFYARQVLYPVLVTVYNSLECHGMDILPFSSMDTGRDFFELDGLESKEREIWKLLFQCAAEDGEWCLFTIDVRNTYGMPFDVTFDREQPPEEIKTVTRLVAPGATSRIVLPMKRFRLPESQISSPIPTLSNRQFVISKSNLTSREEKHQRELFWYREELFKYVKARWREAGGSRFGYLSLRQQRLTAPMLDSLRTDRARLWLSLVRYEDEKDAAYPSRGSKSTSPPNELLCLRITVTNQSPSPLVLAVSLTLNPSEHVLYDGVLSDIMVGRLEGGEARQLELGICFVAEGRFDVLAEARVVNGNLDDDTKAGKGELRVFVRGET